MKQTKQLFLILVMLIYSSSGYSKDYYGIVIDGIKYDLFAKYDASGNLKKAYGGVTGSQNMENLVIPSSVHHDGHDFTIIYIADNGFDRTEESQVLKYLELPSTIQEIRSFAFQDCVNLESVVIPETSALEKIWDDAFYGCSKLSSINLPNSLKIIDSGAFTRCKSLTSIAIPNSVIEVGNYAFFECSNLASVTLSNSLTKILQNTFEGCISLTSIEIPEGVELISEKAFTGCSSLESIKLSSSLTSIENLSFSGCSNINTIVSKIDNPFKITEGVFETSIYENANLYIPIGTKEKYKEVSAWNKFKRIIDSAEQNVISGDTIAIDNLCYELNVTEKVACVVGVSDAVRYDNEGEYIIFPSIGELSIPERIKYKGTEYSVTSIGDRAFRGVRIGTITIPNSVETIGQEAFLGDKKTESGYVSNLIMGTGVKSIGYAAFGTSSAGIKVHISDLVAWCNISHGGGIGLSSSSNPLAFGHLYMNGQEVNQLEIPSGITTIKSMAFFGCSSITSLIIPNSAASIESSAFAYCDNLTSLTISNGVATIGKEAFKSCEGLSLITIPESVTTISESAFYGCRGLTSITIPKNVSSIGKCAFANCYGLTSVITEIKNPFEIGPNTFTISEGFVHEDYIYGNVPLTVPAGTADLYKATSDWNKFEIIIDPAESTELNVGDTFTTEINDVIFVFIVNGPKTVNLCKCSNVSRVEIPSTVTYDGVDYTVTEFLGTATGNVYMPNHPVFGSNVKEVAIPNTITSIGACSFWKCENLTSVTIPSSVITIGDDAFLGCTSLSSIDLPSNLKTIGEYAFSNCSLSSVSIPVSVTTIGYGAFQIEGIKVNTTDLTAFANIKPIEDRDTRIYGSFCPNWKLYVNNREVTSLSIPESISSVGAIFAFCTSLTSLKFHKNVTEIAKAAFWGCNNINKVVAQSETPVKIYDAIRFDDIVLENATLYVPTGTTEAYKKAGWKFTNISEDAEGPDPEPVPEDMIIEDGVVYEIGDNYTAIIYVVEGDRIVASYEVLRTMEHDGIEYEVVGIGDGVFENQTNLEEITIPNSIISIGDNAFAGCSGLKEITIYATTPPELGNSEANTRAGGASSVFDGVDKENTILYVPQGSMEAYRAAEGWGEFTHIVEMGTAIRGIVMDGEPFDVYNLQGQKVLSGVTSLKSLPRGIYIVRSTEGRLQGKNGRKVRR